MPADFGIRRTGGAMRPPLCTELVKKLLGASTNAEKFRHLLVQEAFSRPVRLHPLAVDYELRDRPLSYIPYNLFCCAWRDLDIHFPKGNLMFLEKPLCHSAIGAPASGIHRQLHVLR